MDKSLIEAMSAIVTGTGAGNGAADVLNQFLIGAPGDRPRYLTDFENIRGNFIDAYVLNHANRTHDEAYDVSAHMRDSLRPKTPYHHDDYGFFSLFYIMTKDVLCFSGTELVCKFDEYTDWKEATIHTGQSLFAMAKRAWESVHGTGNVNTPASFEFNHIIKSDNTELPRLLRKGVAESHFHLKGSANVFGVNWTCLMNYISNRGSGFQTFCGNGRGTWNPTHTRDCKDLHQLIIAAAAIRYYLTIVLDGTADTAGTDYRNLRRRIDLATNLSESLYLQSEITAYRHAMNTSHLDYCHSGGDRNAYSVFAGEHRFLFRVFSAIYENEPRISGLYDLFYAYILIYVRFRKELVQCDERIGFYNFMTYETRKDIFIEGRKKYKDALIRSAVLPNIDNPDVRMFEARVTPRNNQRETLKMISDIMEKCRDRAPERAERVKKLFFTATLIKAKDREITRHGAWDGIEVTSFYRHQEVIERTYTPQINAVIEGFKHWDDSRIYAIDACNHERYCRPEVFAPLFRKARSLSVPTEAALLMRGEKDRSPLKITYHAGEDFADLLSGLRAIDEAVKFLEMTYGDRIGHGLALGINPYDFYRLKDYRVLLPKQELLDNVMWLIKALERYNCGTSYLMSRLHEKFSELVTSIYNSKCEELKKVKITVQDYYNAWLLRGDNPGVYRRFDFESRSAEYDISDAELLNPWKIRHCPETDNIRMHEKTSLCIYFSYHYNTGVRREGGRSTEFRIYREYTDAVHNVQKNIRRELCEKRISIETNPTSNRLIGTFGKYDNHPLIAFNDEGLGDASEQLLVSVNTDDQGIFDTDLECEYTLIAAALLNKRNDTGNRVYNSTRVMNYIDSIREKGLSSSFLPIGGLV
ncbi:hypothetical protein FACS1894120_0280 [Clostridia bacterium]|nr:hypothetical protein FACS1894120_0280 [Clostridia bacterium]